MIIPEAALGQHIAVLGKTGSGKTFAIKGIVEALLTAHKRVGIVDPTGAWWGLRASRDGKAKGFPILVLGGDHGDLPLPALGGSAVARLLAEQSVNLIADTSQLTVGERTRWFIDFGRELYRLNRAPLHLVIDEAHIFAPQGKVPDPDTGKMLHAANTLASGGRSRGIRLTMITQRPQKLHKDTLTCADTLIAMRVLAPHDRMAVEDWIKGCGDMNAGKEVLNSLAGLKRGEGWAWYPEGGFLKRLTFPPIITFDSSATPTDGHVVAAPKGMADIDLTEITAAMADAVREAEANDPKLLRAEIARLKVAAGKHPAAPAVDPKAIEAAEQRGYDRGRGDAFDAVWQLANPLHRAFSPLRDQIDGFFTGLRRAHDAAPPPRQRHESPAPASASAAPPRRALPGSPTNGSMGKAERLILTALAQYPNGRTKPQVAILTGYAVTGGAFNNALGALRSRAWITRGNPVQITGTGLGELGPYDPLPQGPELLAHWLGNLGKAERLILGAAANAYPGALNKQQVAVAAGYEASGGAFNNALGRLRSLELIKGRGEIKASDDLF